MKKLKKFGKLSLGIIIIFCVIFYKDFFIKLYNKIEFEQEIVYRKAESYFCTAQNFAEIIGGEYYDLDGEIKIVYGIETLKFNRNEYWTNVVNFNDNDTFIASYYKENEYYIDIEPALKYLEIENYSLDKTESFLKTTQKQQVPILMYHHIVMLHKKQPSDYGNSSVMNNVEFERQMKFLKEAGYNTITIRELYEHLYEERELPLNPIVITFDDGYYSNYRVAYPILKKYDYTASEYLILKSVNERYYDVDYDYPTSKLSWDHIQKMRDVFEFHSHTYNLHRLTKNNESYLTSEDIETVEEDIQSSLNLLEKYNVDKIRTIAYPYGQYNDEVINLLKLYDYKVGITIDRGFAREENSPFKINRVTILPGMTMDEYKKKIGYEK